MLLSFMYLSQTDWRYELAKEPAIKFLLVSAAYVTAIFMAADGQGASYSPINPAIASNLIIVQLIAGSFSANFAWLYYIFPFCGALLGLIVFEFVYKRSMDKVQEQQNELRLLDALDKNESALLLDNNDDKT